MKRVIGILGLALTLTACSVVQTTPFDSNEYSNFIEILTTSEQLHDMCGSATQQQMAIASRLLDAKAHHLVNHAKYQLNNENMVEITTIIRDTTADMVKRYETSMPSSQYCLAKTLTIRAQAELSQSLTTKDETTTMNVDSIPHLAELKSKDPTIRALASNIEDLIKHATTGLMSADEIAELAEDLINTAKITKLKDKINMDADIEYALRLLAEIIPGIAPALKLISDE